MTPFPCRAAATELESCYLVRLDSDQGNPELPNLDRQDLYRDEAIHPKNPPLDHELAEGETAAGSPEWVVSREQLEADPIPSLRESHQHTELQQLAESQSELEPVEKE